MSAGVYFWRSTHRVWHIGKKNIYISLSVLCVIGFPVTLNKILATCVFLKPFLILFHFGVEMLPFSHACLFCFSPNNNTRTAPWLDRVNVWPWYSLSNMFLINSKTCITSLCLAFSLAWVVKIIIFAKHVFHHETCYTHLLVKHECVSCFTMMHDQQWLLVNFKYIIMCPMPKWKKYNH